MKNDYLTRDEIEKLEASNLQDAAKDMFYALQVLLKQSKQDSFSLTRIPRDTPAEVMAQRALNKAMGIL